jgi:flagellar hook-associated protein 3 FlgL
MRLGSANLFDRALQNLYTRQTDLSSQQEKLTSGKNVNRASDDPTGVAQAERALTRITRIASDQRALGLQRNAVSLAESNLGDATGLVQRLRELVVSAGNGGYSAANRSSIAQEITGLRDQLLALANSTDTNGIPLFGGLGSASAPFTETATGVVFNGITGQQAAGTDSIPSAMDGQAVWMNVATGNGTFNTSLGVANTGTAWTETGQVVTPGLVTGDNYSITFSVAAGLTTYSVVNTTSGATVATAQPYKDGQAITFDGLAITARGAPAQGDTLSITPSTTTNLFKVIDDAITGIGSSTANNKVSQAVTLALAQIDTGMFHLQAARSQAGEWLNRADNIQNAQEGRSVQLAADKSRAEDLDMVKGISDFTRLQTGYQAALQSYAQVQKLSLFNYIN